MLAVIADQVQVPASTFSRYGDRDHTLYEHLDEIRQTYHFREYGWKEYLWLARKLLPLALERDRPLPLIEHALVGEDIAPTFYEVAAFDALKGRVRSGILLSTEAEGIEPSRGISSLNPILISLFRNSKLGSFFVASISKTIGMCEK